MDIQTLGWLILAFPLLGAIVIGLTFKALPQRVHGVIGTLAIAAAFVCAVLALLALGDRGEEDKQVVSSLYDYAVSLGVDAKLSILIDPLSIMMALVVTGVSTLIHLYSTAYMESDRGYTRFFAYLNFFVFSMLLLVLAGNFVLLIVGWAFVGAASYLLISFWYRRKTATQAGIKAFVINVVGDVGLVLGAFFILRGTDSLDFLTVFSRVEESFTVNQGSLVAGCLLLLVGAFAKSAQVPFHTWLPDAMEGPTPVSALIHAATMVTAGVYLIARMHPLFEQAPAAADVGAVIGCATLLIAATIGLVVTDLKRVIAYSTMSQIGYMVMGVSSAAYASGIYHLGTHAFFKALLFMAAGSVISAMANIQDLNKMGGFRKAMPFTYGCFIVGGLALAGVFPFSGLFSKDEILAYTMDRGGWHVVLGVLGYLGAFMTAVYTFRMIFRAFHGEPCEEAKELMETGHIHHGHPVNPVSGEPEDTEVGFPGPDHHIAEQAGGMKIAMSVLAVGAIGLGVLQIPGVTHVVDSFLEPVFADSELAESLHPSVGTEWVGLIVGTVIGLAGIGLAYRLWVQSPATPARIQARLSGLHTFFVNKWFFDELIDFLIVKPFAAFGRFARDVFERFVVNGLVVGGSSGLVRASSAVVRAAQSGFLRAYAALLVLGVAAVSLYFLVNAS
jgi:NADH-quinone oxidoreductase subunit L